MSKIESSEGLGILDAESAAGQTETAKEPLAKRILPAFNRWRRSRPFWGALILIVGGWQVMAPMVGADLNLILRLGMRGVSPLLIGGLMILCALLAVLVPSNRHFLGIAALVMSLISLPFANLGGWILGMVLGLLGSSMIFAWAPYTEKQLAEFAGKERQKAERKARRDQVKAGGRRKSAEAATAGPDAP